MTWLTPLLAAAAAAVLVPSLVILYFLKLKRIDLDVSSTLLWRQAIEDLRANAPFQRLRKNLLLVLQLVALALALLALAQPLLHADRAPAGRTVLVIDRSASMSAADAGPDDDPASLTRLEAAKASARRVVESMRTAGPFDRDGGDLAMVIAFDRGAEVLQPFTDNKDLLLAAIDSIGPTDAASRLDDALALAAAYAAEPDSGAPAPTDEPPASDDAPGAPAAAVVLFSDGSLPDAPRLNPPVGPAVLFERVGRDGSPNTAVTSFRVERAYDRPSEVSVFVGVQSTDPARTSADVRLAVDGSVAAVRSVALEPLEGDARTRTGAVVFRLSRREGAALSVTLEGADALPADDAAVAVLPPASPVRVALVTEGNLALRTALEGLNVSGVMALSPAAFTDAGGRGPWDVAVLDNWAPTDPALLPPGSYLTFGVRPPIAGLAAPDEPPAADRAVHAVLNWRRDHPALELADLEPLRIAELVPIESVGVGRVLASSTAGPAILETTADGRRALVVAFDVLDSNWPFDVNYILFLAGAIEHLGSAGGGSAGAQSPVGTVLSTRLPEGARDAQIVLPDGSAQAVPIGTDGRVSWGPARTAGLHVWRWTGDAGPADRLADGRPARPVAAVLLDADESAIAAPGAIAFRDARTEATTAGAAGGGPGGGSAADAVRELWHWFLLAAAAVLILEWWIYNRRAYV